MMKNKPQYLILFIAIWMFLGIQSIHVKAQDNGPKSLSNNLVLDTYGNPVLGVEIGIKEEEYVFTNKNRTVIVTQSDDDFAIKGTPIVGDKKPFVFELLCD